MHSPQAGTGSSENGQLSRASLSQKLRWNPSVPSSQKSTANASNDSSQARISCVSYTRSVDSRITSIPPDVRFDPSTSRLCIAVCATMGVQLVPAEFSGFVVETLLYGMYFILHMMCMYVLIFREWRSSKYHRRSINKVLVTASTVLFLAITVHWIINVIRAFNALVANGETPTGSIISYGRVSDTLDVVGRGALYSLEIVVADVIMLYRVWIVWEHNLLACIFPALSCVGSIVTGIGITYEFTRVPAGQDVFMTACGRWITAAFVLTLATNLYCSVMISYRLWDTNRGMSVLRIRSSKLVYTIVLIVESTIIYTFFSLVTLIASLAKSDVQFITLDATSPVIGLAFSLVIVRAGLGLGHQHMSTILVNAPETSRDTDRSRNSAYPLAMKIRQHTETIRVVDEVYTLEKQDEVKVNEHRNEA